MWWAVFIVLFTGHHHKLFTSSQVFTSLGECEQFVEKLDITPPKKGRVQIFCDNALEGSE